MKKNPLVTVFMPVFNCEKYIKESLESIINQTYANLEILIIDDGSTDNTLDIINSYNDKRLRILKNGENRGIPYTRNRGLKESKGKYMAVMDADDIAYLNRIEKQVIYMEENQDIDVLGSYFNIFGGRFNKSYKPQFTSPEEISAGLLFSNPIGNSTILIRLDIIKTKELSYNEKYFVAQDYDMWVQISKVGKILILPEILIKYRLSSNNITKKSTGERLMQRRKIINSIHQDIFNFFNFKLTEKEISVFNEFFSDDNQQVIDHNTLSNIPKVLNKIVEQNKSNSLFSEEMLLSIMKEAVLNNLNSRKFSIFSKFNIYNKVCRIENASITKEVTYMITKHLYKLLRSNVPIRYNIFKNNR